MIDLSQPTAPYELDLPYGLKVTVRPADHCRDGRRPPATPPSTGTGVVTFLMG